MQQLDSVRKSWQEIAAPGTVFPQHLWIQVDNAGGENKNTHICKLCAYLVDAGMFRSVVLSTLQVGNLSTTPKWGGGRTPATNESGWGLDPWP